MLLRILKPPSISPQNRSIEAQNATNPGLYEFGPYRLEEARGMLFKQGDQVPLVPKAFGLLLLLVRSGGETVEKGDLKKALWPGAFVEEGNLTQTVFMLRK